MEHANNRIRHQNQNVTNHGRAILARRKYFQMSECLNLGGKETTIDWHCDTVYHSSQIGQEKKDWTDDIFNFTKSVKWNCCFHWISFFWF